MAKKNNSFKQITVREHPVQSLFEAGIYGLDLKKGDQLVVVGNLLFPVHDESKVQLTLRHIKDLTKQTALTGNTVHVVMLGPVVDEESAKSLWNKEMNFIHTQDDPQVVKDALNQRGYDKPECRLIIMSLHRFKTLRAYSRRSILRMYCF